MFNTEYVTVEEKFVSGYFVVYFAVCRTGKLKVAVNFGCDCYVV